MGARKFDVETTFINALMADGDGLTVVRAAQQQMGLIGIDLCDICTVLANGRVVRSDMLEDHGLWTVRGVTIDEVVLDLTVEVISSEYEVKLIKVIRVWWKG